eukprot:gene23380-biopygen7285
MTRTASSTRTTRTIGDHGAAAPLRTLSSPKTRPRQSLSTCGMQCSQSQSKQLGLAGVESKMFSTPTESRIFGGGTNCTCQCAWHTRWEKRLRTRPFLQILQGGKE